MFKENQKEIAHVTEFLFEFNPGLPMGGGDLVLGPSAAISQEDCIRRKQEAEQEWNPGSPIWDTPAQCVRELDNSANYKVTGAKTDWVRAKSNQLAHS